MRRLALATPLAVAALFLAACGQGSASLSDVKVSKGDTPEVKIGEGFTTEKSESHVVKKGGGDKVDSGDTIKINYVAVNGRTGKEFDNSYAGGKPMALTLDKKLALPGFHDGLVGKKVGSRVLVSVAPKDGADLLESADSLGLKADDTMVFLFDIVAKIPDEASGKAKKAPASLPKLEFNKDGQPKGFKATKKSDKKVKKTASSVLIEGSGDKVEAGQLVTMHYLGQKYPDGDIFDESWSSAARQMPIGSGGLIKCWDDELVGKKVGSRVVITCTAKDAYGAKPEQEGQPSGALIFVVDLLDAI